MNYNIRVKHYPPEHPGPEDSFYISKGQTLFIEKAPDLFPGIVFTGWAGSLLACLNPRIAKHIWVNLRGGTVSRVKNFWELISYTGIYPEIPNKKFLAFF